MSMQSNGDVLLDDGDFFVEHSCTSPAGIANGFLMRCCRVSPTTPEGADCVGGYYLELDGMWRADLAIHHDGRTGSECHLLGRFGNRHEADTPHPRD
ncbi:MAG: hypothetical protein CPSOU_6287 [uncultured Paraburkholderia sp.]|nr:MAG: hypothetical protein CPSOU_6287 [uncultured Paraburkholderia sp.]